MISASISPVANQTVPCLPYSQIYSLSCQAVWTGTSDPSPRYVYLSNEIGTGICALWELGHGWLDTVCQNSVCCTLWWGLDQPLGWSHSMPICRRNKQKVDIDWNVCISCYFHNLEPTLATSNPQNVFTQSQIAGNIIYTDLVHNNNKIFCLKINSFPYRSINLLLHLSMLNFIEIQARQKTNPTDVLK